MCHDEAYRWCPAQLSPPGWFMSASAACGCCRHQTMNASAAGRWFIAIWSKYCQPGCVATKPSIGCAGMIDRPGHELVRALGWCASHSKNFAAASGCVPPTRPAPATPADGSRSTAPCPPSPAAVRAHSPEKHCCRSHCQDRSRHHRWSLHENPAAGSNVKRHRAKKVSTRSRSRAAPRAWCSSCRRSRAASRRACCRWSSR